MGSLAGDPSEEEEKNGVVVGRERNGGGRRAGGVPDLLEEAWFFRKLIDGSSENNKPPPVARFMGRCYSDPTSSQSVVPPPAKGGGGGLARAPSLPPCIGSRSDKSGEYGRKSGGGRRNNRKSSEAGDNDKKGSSKMKGGGGGGRNPGSLRRAPSLPPWIGREEEEEEESDGEENGMSMSRLIRQAISSSLEDIPTPPRKHSAPSSPSQQIGMRNEMMRGGARRRSPEGSDERVIKQSGVISNTNHNNNNNVGSGKGIRKLSKTMSNLEIQHDQANYYEARKATRPSYDHLLRCAGPPIPTWAGPTANNAKAKAAAATSSGNTNSSAAEDMKAHLKVWARTVAANIH